jgi:hypothetical protein
MGLEVLMKAARPASDRMCRLTGQKLVVETAAAHSSPEMREFMEQEARAVSKQWVWEVVAGAREAGEVRLRTRDFVLLPDIHRVNRPSLTAKRQVLRWRSPLPTYNMYDTLLPRRPSCSAQLVNWLAIVTEPGLRTIRDLRGRHVPMLEALLEQSKRKISLESGVPPEEIMAYVHYPPSVYQLHVHFAYPYAQYNHRDVYRIHSVETLIANLKVDTDFYLKADLQVSLSRGHPMYSICSEIAPVAKQRARRHSWS